MERSGASHSPNLFPPSLHWRVTGHHVSARLLILRVCPIHCRCLPPPDFPAWVNARHCLDYFVSPFFVCVNHSRKGTRVSSLAIFPHSPLVGKDGSYHLYRTFVKGRRRVSEPSPPPSDVFPAGGFAGSGRFCNSPRVAILKGTSFHWGVGTNREGSTKIKLRRSSRSNRLAVCCINDCVEYDARTRLAN